MTTSKIKLFFFLCQLIVININAGEIKHSHLLINRINDSSNTVGHLDFLNLQETKATNIYSKQIGGTTDKDPGVGTYSRDGNVISYHWRYVEEGSTYDFSFDLIFGDYDEMQKYYSNMQHNVYGAYKKFVLNDPYKNTLKVVADALEQLANKYDLSKTEVALSFVQALPYDDLNHEIQRYSVETLIDCRGDCSDTSVLFAGLLWEMGYGFVFLHYPNHLAIGIYGRKDFLPEGTHYSYEGRDYYLCETTGTGNPIGFGLNQHQHGDGTADIEEF